MQNSGRKLRTQKQTVHVKNQVSNRLRRRRLARGRSHCVATAISAKEQSLGRVPFLPMRATTRWAWLRGREGVAVVRTFSGQWQINNHGEGKRGRGESSSFRCTCAPLLFSFKLLRHGWVTAAEADLFTFVSGFYCSGPTLENGRGGCLV